jgi:hypothetical protein
MMEQEWLSCEEPSLMLDYLAGNVVERKLRLFAYACCRRIRRSLFHSVETLLFLELFEHFTDGECPEPPLESIQTARWQASSGLRWRNSRDPVFPAEGAVSRLWPDLRVQDILRHTNEVAAYESLCHAVQASILKRSYRWWKRGPKLSEKEVEAAESEGIRLEQMAHSELVREIFGNPFRPIAFDAAWLTSTVLALARGIYKDRAFDRMPILADALQGAGCDNAAILDHCREPNGVHTRGCFVVDMLLGKS